MSKNILVVPDAHAHPDFNNDRFDWLGQLLLDLRPDVVVNLGDGADMPSLCGYDKGKKSFHGRTYKADVDSFLDSQDRLWGPLRRAKKKLPYSIYCVGNHEERIRRAVELQPELEGTVTLNDLELRRWYDNVVDYDGGSPGIADVEGVQFAHYFISGVMGRAIGGEHPGYSLITKRLRSSTCGHVHTLDYCVRTNGSGRKVMGCVAGVYQDYRASWAGGANDLWWPGVIFKRNVEDGCYDPEFISLEAIKREYA